MSLEEKNNKGMIKIMKAYKGFKYNKKKETFLQFMEFIKAFLEDEETNHIFELSYNFSSYTVVYRTRYSDDTSWCSVDSPKHFINSLFKESQQTKKSLKGK